MSKLKEFSNIILLVYLMILGFWDLREKRVPMLLLAAGSLLAACMKMLVLVLAQESLEWMLLSIMLGILPGIFMIGVAKLTEKAGTGDGWSLLNVGLFTDYKTCVMLWGFSLIAMAVFSAVLLMLHKAERSTRIPYLPFVALVHTIGMLI